MTVTTRAGKGAKLTNAEMDSNMNSLNWRHGGTLASSSTITPTDEYNYFDISGTASVSGMSATHSGNLIRMTFLAAGGTLVHNATSFVLPGNANITWAAGDTAVFVNTNSTNWKCIAYQVQASVPGDVVDLTAIASVLMPVANSIYNIGSPTLQWNNLYVDGLGNLGSVSLSTGATVSEFSTDGTLAGNSDTAVPTEKAVKTYVGPGHVTFASKVSSPATPVFDNTVTGWSIARTAAGEWTVTHPIGDTNYTVQLTSEMDVIANQRIITAGSLGSTTFTVNIRNSSGVGQDDPFHIMVWEY